MSGVVSNDGTYNGVIGDVRPLKSKVLEGSRTDSAADGSVSLTGCGFTPTAAIVVGTVDYHSAGMGIASTQNEFQPGEGHAACFTIRAAGFGTGTEWGRYNDDTEGSTGISGTNGKVLFRNSMNGGNVWYLHLESWDADGATFYCNKYGGGTGDLYFRVLFMR